MLLASVRIFCPRAPKTYGLHTKAAAVFFTKNDTKKGVAAMQFFDEKQNALEAIWWSLCDVKNEKRYCKKLKQQLNAWSLTEEFGHLAAPETPVEESRRFFQSVRDHSIAQEEERIADFLRVAEEAGIPREDAAELADYLPLCLRQEGENVLLNVGGIATYHHIVFCNAQIDGEKFYLPDHIELSKTEEGYLLEFVEEETIISMPFSHVEMRLSPIHAACATDYFLVMAGTPWDFLAQYARGIAEHIQKGIANERELALGDIAKYLADEQLKQVPESFLELARRHNAERAVEKYMGKRQKLFRELSKQKYEPIWRELFEAFEASQEGLPQEWEFYCTSEQFEEHKRFVTVQMRLRGFEGEYPHFCKKAPFRRLSLMNAFGESFFVGFEKHASHHIYCRADCRGGEKKIHENYLCGTVFRKTPEEETDIWSCFFDRRGKTNFSAVFHYPQEESTAEERSLLASAAAKSAELRRLTKEERTLKQNFQTPALVYILMFLFMAVFFGAFWTLGFMLIISIMTLLVTFSFAMVAEIILGIPWLLVAVVAGVLFALPMTIVAWLADRK